MSPVRLISCFVDRGAGSGRGARGGDADAAERARPGQARLAVRHQLQALLRAAGLAGPARRREFSRESQKRMKRLFSKGFTIVINKLYKNK